MTVPEPQNHLLTWDVCQGNGTVKTVPYRYFIMLIAKPKTAAITPNSSLLTYFLVSVQYSPMLAPGWPVHSLER